MAGGMVTGPRAAEPDRVRVGGPGGRRDGHRAAGRSAESGSGAGGSRAPGTGGRAGSGGAGPASGPGARPRAPASRGPSSRRPSGTLCTAALWAVGSPPGRRATPLCAWSDGTVSGAVWTPGRSREPARAATLTSTWVDTDASPSGQGLRAHLPPAGARGRTATRRCSRTRTASSRPRARAVASVVPGAASGSTIAWPGAASEPRRPSAARRRCRPGR